MKVLVEADGGSRGNPGPAGYGSVVWSEDHQTVLAESKQAIGRATNNVAEYRGLIAGLDEAVKLGATDVAVSMDSKLVVEQMAGRWRVKHPDLAALHAQARALTEHFDRVSYAWIPREQNSHADRLANEAMDAAAEALSAGQSVAEPAAEPAEAAQAERNSSPGWTGARGAPTRFLLLRHGQTELSVQRRYSGRGNPALTDLGRRQANAAAEYLAQRGGISAVIASPLQRAYDTATTAAKALGLDVDVDDDLIETDFGDWEGLTFSEAAAQDPELHRRWLRDTSTTPPDGESFAAVHTRVQRARDRIIAEHGGTTVLVVSHVTPIKMLLRVALDA
ncbi:MAG TPA: bifunctional RNase H/acid phosphatase, partial [Mycobacterium sp.]|nr:bifunctional RNase H/acid phosphatase [Mycobacterium sp.]